MKAWLIYGISDLITETKPLNLAEINIPVAQDHQILIKISCCGICHTELDEIEGRTAPPHFPVVPGHQVVGKVAGRGSLAQRFKRGDRVGVAWIFSACGHCEFCLSGLENLCVDFEGTGRDQNGGYAEFMVIDEDFAFSIPPVFKDAEAAPLLCAGAIGYRSIRLTGLKNGQPLGLTGFGASGHLVLKMVLHLFPRSPVYVFARSGEEQQFALQLGATWSGEISQKPPTLCQAIIDTTPAWAPVLGSLLQLTAGGRLVINAIRKEAQDKETLLQINYQEHLWMEKEIKSVANLVRSDVDEFLALAANIPLIPTIETYSFEQANEALLDLKNKHVKGGKVLIIESI